jgi:hypothetical protein
MDKVEYIFFTGGLYRTVGKWSVMHQAKKKDSKESVPLFPSKGEKNQPQSPNPSQCTDHPQMVDTVAVVTAIKIGQIAYREW